MPLSHSHQFLCVSLRFCDTVVSSAGFAGSVTFQIWCAWLPKVRRRYTLLLSPLGSCDPSHTRTICAPPASARPGWPGMCARYFGCLGSVTSRIDVPLFSFWPVRGLSTLSPWCPTYAIQRLPCLWIVG